MYAQQREVLTQLLDALWQSGTRHLDVMFRDAFVAAPDDRARRRAIVDQVASLTDQSALAMHAALCGDNRA